MENLFGSLLLLSLSFLLIGLFSPKASLFWMKKERTKKKSALIYGAILVASFFMFGMTTDIKPELKAANEKNEALIKAQTDSINAAEKKMDSIALVREQAASRKEKIEKQFSAWNGAHKNLEKYIKQNMNDPDSYEHVETSYWDMKDHLVVLTKFRGKNAFGGKVMTTIKAKVDMQGKVLEIIDRS